MGTYTNSREIKKPNDNDKIWRYMDFTKFIDMLHYKALHFTRVDKLKDPYDTSIASYFAEKTGVSTLGLERIKSLEAGWRKQQFVNCWHVNASESAALWKMYMKSNEGIAIQTTVKKLVTTLEVSNKDVSFDLASVNYDPSKLRNNTITPNGKSVQVLNFKATLFTKRPCFSFENELRVFVHIDEPKSTGFKWEDLDINSLIEFIYINSEAPHWVFLLVRDLAKSHNIEAKVRKSNIY